MAWRVVKGVFPRLFLHLLGCSNKWFTAIFEPSCTKLQKSLEMGNFWTDNATKGGLGGVWGEGS